MEFARRNPFVARGWLRLLTTVAIVGLVVVGTTLTAGSALGLEPETLDLPRSHVSTAPAKSSAGALLAFQSWRGDWEIELARPDGSGRNQLTRNRFDDRFPDWSPDATRLAVVRSGVPGQLATRYVIRVDGSESWRLGRAVSAYEWSPDGGRIAFTERGGLQLTVANADGSGRRTIFGGEPHGFEWSPNGRALAFGCGPDLCVAYMKDPRFSKLIRNASNPDWSPQGGRIAFLRPVGRGGRYGVFVARPDGTGVTRLLPMTVDSLGKLWSWCRMGGQWRLPTAASGWSRPTVPRFGGSPADARFSGFPGHRKDRESRLTAVRAMTSAWRTWPPVLFTI